MKAAKFLSLFSVLLFVSIFHASFARADCFAVIVGKKASADGSVLVGHNEQNGGRVILNYRCVPRMKHKPGLKVTLKNGGTLPEVAETNAMIWREMPGLDFSDSYFNEHGVMVASNACPTREDSCDELVKRGDITDGGIGYMLRRLVAQRAKTAKEGVSIAGELVNRFGYCASGRSYIIADPDEAWVFSVVRGKRWIAQRCPDDGVVLLANVHIIGAEADLKDRENVMASAGLVDYAAKHGWYDPASGKPFSFKNAFNKPPGKGSFEEKYGCDPRQWYAQSLVTGRFIELPVREPLPFSVKLARKMTVRDVAKILRSHGEKIPEDAVKKKGKDDSDTAASISALATICSRDTQEGAVYQLRSALPKENRMRCLADYRPAGLQRPHTLVPGNCRNAQGLLQGG
jgi:dipeptidase